MQLAIQGGLAAALDQDHIVNVAGMADVKGKVAGLERTHKDDLGALSQKRL